MRYLILPFLYLLVCALIHVATGWAIGDRGFYAGLAVLMLLTVFSDRRLNP